MNETKFFIVRMTLTFDFVMCMISNRHLTFRDSEKNQQIYVV